MMNHRTLDVVIELGRRAFVELALPRKKSALPAVAKVAVGGILAAGAVIGLVPRLRQPFARAVRSNLLVLEDLLTLAHGEPNEGEGNRTAARRYAQATRDYIRSGKVEKAAAAALRSVAGSEADDLSRAADDGMPAR